MTTLQIIHLVYQLALMAFTPLLTLVMISASRSV
jgi:hypothetical protein